MSRTIHCQKLNKNAEGLDRPTYPGELGQRIFDNISKEAWDMWLTHQTMLINEYRLSMIDPKARSMLVEEMEKFLFSNSETEKPGGYTAPEE
ncbi:putative Fe(2+)-trafficking protein [Piscirickettsia salmonis]|uniref:Probable Fe(2+)-trafficking protein n=1 Tax=Piscirickettsia salmonis TaxID=1238 RepID=A0A1L6TD72_PISSA|nr:oxidative damage protection protein [Piscirickettsia salmonis]AKP74399.1 Fe(2+)-trafficking protein [Piscirickettsia salmonis LF-89 = ATCC VR-1361]ALB23350.1 Fe(II) trafficking protein YggX [Piscirickettsia salmonis]ALY03244.1 Fe(2+)-trafficking protein [Piscirickettsia salmonis]AMA42810.1 Fe(2+)-trafficking protein [Piscirickettsia salmonis]AOS35279.1 Fe(2+)-trafficking protein [Piscirickettsia salmonis]